MDRLMAGLAAADGPDQLAPAPGEAIELPAGPPRKATAGGNALADELADTHHPTVAGGAQAIRGLPAGHAGLVRSLQAQPLDRADGLGRRATQADGRIRRVDDEPAQGTLAVAALALVGREHRTHLLLPTRSKCLLLLIHV
jgi:hypothetical protein